MLDNLSKGFLVRIFSGEEVTDPVLQLIGYRPIQEIEVEKSVQGYQGYQGLLIPLCINH